MGRLAVRLSTVELFRDPIHGNGGAPTTTGGVPWKGAARERHALAGRAA
jgi:hypothetical protein